MVSPSEGLAFFYPVFRIAPIIFLIEAVDERQKGIIFFDAIQHVFARLLQLVARAIRIEAGSSDDAMMAAIVHP